MRPYLYAVLSALTLGLVTAAPASAAVAWECMGPAASCVSGKGSVTKSNTVSAKATRKQAYKAKKSSKQAKSTKSYSGGGSGMASYYWQGQQTASGARFNPNALTAAHKTLPFGTRVLVTNLRNGRSVTVTINDRGPFIRGRVIDLSLRAAGEIGMKGAGVVPISMQVVGRG